jgi:AcrR family transcriptional regulator
MNEEKKNTEEDESIKSKKFESILISARTLIEKEGFSNITMDKVAQNAGIAKGTIYLYFKNKNEVLEKVLENGFQRMFKRVSENVNSKTCLEDKIKTLIYENLLYISENRYFFKTIFLDEMHVVFLKKKSQESFNLRRKKYAQFISEIIKKGVEDGKVKECTDPFKYGYFLISLIKTNAIYNFNNNTIDLPEEWINQETEELFNIFMKGVLQ